MGGISPVYGMECLSHFSEREPQPRRILWTADGSKWKIVALLLKSLTQTQLVCCESFRLLHMLRSLQQTPFDMVDWGSRSQQNGAADPLASIIHTSTQAVPQQEGLFNPCVLLMVVQMSPQRFVHLKSIESFGFWKRLGRGMYVSKVQSRWKQWRFTCYDS